MGNIDKTLVIVLILVLVIMGPTQVPKLMKMFGKSAKALKDGMEGKLEDDEDAPAPKPKTEPVAKKDDASEE